MKPRRICRIIILTISSYSWYKEGDTNKTWEGVIRLRKCKSHYTTIYCKNKCIKKFSIKCEKHYLIVIIATSSRLELSTKCSNENAMKYIWSAYFITSFSRVNTNKRGVFYNQQNEFMSLIMVNGLCLDFVKQTFL